MWAACGPAGGRTFLSTLSLRRATLCSLLFFILKIYFYPRSPCGERLHYDNYNLHCVEISIHALLAESDRQHSEPDSGRIRFLSTLSLRRATSARPGTRQPCAISIHALLAESDQKRMYQLSPKAISIHALLAESDRVLEVTRNAYTDFYPRSPCGERHTLI